jgi:hypothetical protein
MNSFDLLRMLRVRRASLRRDEDRLIVKPKHLVEDLIDEIRRHKTEIIWELEYEEFVKMARYPDGQGRVKCVCCARLVDGTCKATGEAMLGVSLLRECGDYISRA